MDDNGLIDKSRVDAGMVMKQSATPSNTTRRWATHGLRTAHDRRWATNRRRADHRLAANSAHVAGFNNYWLDDDRLRVTTNGLTTLNCRRAARMTGIHRR